MQIQIPIRFSLPSFLQAFPCVSSSSLIFLPSWSCIPNICHPHDGIHSPDLGCMDRSRWSYKYDSNTLPICRDHSRIGYPHYRVHTHPNNRRSLKIQSLVVNNCCSVRHSSRHREGNCFRTNRILYPLAEFPRTLCSTPPLLASHPPFFPSAR